MCFCVSAHDVEVLRVGSKLHVDVDDAVLLVSVPPTFGCPAKDAAICHLSKVNDPRRHCSQLSLSSLYERSQDGHRTNDGMQKKAEIEHAHVGRESQVCVRLTWEATPHCACSDAGKRAGCSAFRRKVDCSGKSVTRRAQNGTLTLMRTAAQQSRIRLNGSRCGGGRLSNPGRATNGCLVPRRNSDVEGSSLRHKTRDFVVERLKSVFGSFLAYTTYHREHQHCALFCSLHSPEKFLSS